MTEERHGHDMYDVAIIGAGVVGGMLARTLAAYDLKICILEKESDVGMGAPGPTPVLPTRDMTPKREA